MATAAAIYPPLNQRPLKNTIVLFDVDDTLTIPRLVRLLHSLALKSKSNCSNFNPSHHVQPQLTTPQPVTPEMLQILSELRHKCAIGYVGGSDLVKQQEQLGTSEINVTSLFDFCFPENGLSGFRLGEKLPSTSFIGWLGEEKYKSLVKWYVEPI